MGCGCNKKRPSRSKRIKKQRSQMLRSRKKGLQVSPIHSLSASGLSAKSIICMSCSESKQSPTERKKGIRICHKTNRLINNIIRDPRFICPIGRWRNAK